MDPSQLKKIVIPAVIVAGVILAVGVLFLLIDPGSGGTTASGSGSRGAEPSTEGMSNSLPSTGGPDYKTLDGGVKYVDLKVGEGDECKPGAFVVMHYAGWLLDGREFDCSVRKGEPLKMSLNQLIKGWQIGVPGMKPGGIRRLVIPSEYAYGPSGKGDIPPNSDLVFEVKLLSSK
jgi:FKBP-type peptidyl-prolyl cis-trans isomerase